MAVTSEHLDWIEQEARPTFGLVATRARIFVYALRGAAGFKTAPIARELQLTTQAVVDTLRDLQERELLEVRREKLMWFARPGRRLSAVLGAATGQGTTPHGR